MHDPLEPTPGDDWTILAPNAGPAHEADIESRFTVSNGLLAARGARDVARPPGWMSWITTIKPVAWPRSYVAGVFDVPDVAPPVPVLMPAPDWLCIRIRLQGLPLRPTDTADRRTLDLKRGVVLTDWQQAEGPGSPFRIRTLRLASRADPAIGLQLVHLHIDRDDVDVVLDVRIDPLGVGLDLVALEPGFGLWRTWQAQTQLAMASAVTLRLGGTTLAPTERGPLHWSWHWRSRAGQVACVSRIVAVARSSDAGAAARTALGRACARGWRAELAAHEAAWADRWHCGGVEIAGDAAAQRALRFAVYHLASAANPADERVSVGARALTGDSYLGHVFWDTEIYLLPFYTLTWPAAARALLMYRFHTLAGARAKAAALGWRGAMYTWESADTGMETTPDQILGAEGKPVDVLCGRLEQHITADVAYAVWQYWHATQDDAFLRDAGGEIMLETARFWASRARLETDGRRHIRDVIGPDEYHEHVDDNAFTNGMARWNLCRAAEVADLLRARAPAHWADLANRLGLADAEIAQWREVAATLATGHDPHSGLLEQFTGFLSLEQIDLAGPHGRAAGTQPLLPRARQIGAQVLKQADVVALLALLPEAFDAAATEANFRYYAPRCTHESSLSPAMHALVAARLGQTDLALRYFHESAARDLAGAPGDSAGGVHIAALGGLWQVAVLGFGGLSWRGDTLCFDPRLPAPWQSLGFAVQWRGRRLRVRIGASGTRFEAHLEAGASLDIIVRGTPQVVAPGVPLRITLPATPA